VTNDPSNCGNCGNVCPVGDECLDEECVPTSCTGQFRGTTCALQSDAGFGECCGGTCDDISSDSKNCGGCGRKCANTHTCQNDACVLISCANVPGSEEACEGPNGVTGECCSSTCSTLVSDPQNCGQCGLACLAGQACVESQCVDITCPADAGGFTVTCSTGDGGSGVCCASGCTSIETDVANCGECGKACLTGQTCSFGTCLFVDCTAPESGGELCTNPATGLGGACCAGSCVQESTDLNCGGCGIVCPTGTTCEEEVGNGAPRGSSHPVAPIPPFGATCVNSNFQPVNCADAGCPQGLECLAAAGACVPTSCDGASDGETCVAGSAAGLCCGGACINPSTSGDHCGTCFTSCGDTGVCSLGACVSTVTCAVDNSSSPCALDGGALGLCCHGACEGTESNDSCGACGLACPSGTTCLDGDCVQQDGGFASCPATPCGQGQMCEDGFCESLSCQPGESGALCAFGDGVGGGNDGVCCNGVCTSFQDPQNCGGCGIACASGVCLGESDTCLPESGVDGGTCFCEPGLLCIQGECVFPGSACANGEAEGSFCQVDGGATGLCCGIPPQASCSDLINDPNNCGGCGIVCPAGQTCSDSTCSGSPAICQGSPGKYCDLDAGGDFVCCTDGCVDITSDTNNCGGCGTVCPELFACANRECFATQCNAQTADQLCVPDGGDSVCCGNQCVDELTDARHCGGCQNPCDRGDVCDQGSCVLKACPPVGGEGAFCEISTGGIGECCSTGCSNILNDPANCGGCGITCTGTQQCINEECQ
jgi:hypothetical protein